MIKLLIDTCVWLDIAKDHKQQSIVSVLDDLIEDKVIELILPKIILEEFERNKARILDESTRSVAGAISRVKEIVNNLGDEGEKQKVLTHLSDIQHKTPLLSEYAAKGSINWITTILENTALIKTTNALKLKAAQRAIEKKAPFHRSKNNIADALIIETYIQTLLGDNNKRNRFMFVTHNTDDFSLPVGNKKLPHPDFEKIFTGRRSMYFINLSEALNNIRPKVISEMLVEREAFDRNPRTLTDILEAEDEFVMKVWYNRHQIARERIEEGKIKIIEDKDFKTETSHLTYTKSIWKGAQSSARKVEKKYGKRNLIWNDFEWGMLNGKLSALRWVLGEDWDELYT